MKEISSLWLVGGEVSSINFPMSTSSTPSISVDSRHEYVDHWASFQNSDWYYPNVEFRPLEWLSCYPVIYNYKITYYNGISGTNGDPKIFRCDVSGYISAASEYLYTYKNHKFKYWIDKNGTTYASNEKINLSSNIELSAVWKECLSVWNALSSYTGAGRVDWVYYVAQTSTSIMPQSNSTCTLSASQLSSHCYIQVQYIFDKYDYFWDGSCYWFQLFYGGNGKREDEYKIAENLVWVWAPGYKLTTACISGQVEFEVEEKKNLYLYLGTPTTSCSGTGYGGCRSRAFIRYK